MFNFIKRMFKCQHNHAEVLSIQYETRNNERIAVSYWLCSVCGEEFKTTRNLGRV